MGVVGDAKAASRCMEAEVGRASAGSGALQASTGRASSACRALEPKLVLVLMLEWACFAARWPRVEVEDEGGPDTGAPWSPVLEASCSPDPLREYADLPPAERGQRERAAHVRSNGACTRR